MRGKKLSEELWFFILPYFNSEFERQTTFTENVSATDRKQGRKLRTKVIFCNVGIFPEVGNHHFWTARHH